MATHEPVLTVTPEHEPNPEPLPEWETAFNVWKVWWEIHNYGFGCAFAILAFFSIFCLVRLRSLQKLTLGRYFTAVSALLLVFTTSRALYLLLDPYEAHKYITLPVVVVRIMFAVGYPCLTSVFSLINFAFAKVNNLKIILRLQNIKFLTAVILGHFLLVLIIYLVVTFAPQFAKLFIICQTIIIIWWMALVICFLYTVWLVHWNQKLKTKYINRDSKIVELSGFDTSPSNPQSQNTENTENTEGSKGTRKIVRISVAVAVAGLFSITQELYSLFGVYKLYSLDDTFVEPWPWWSFQTASRAVEICLCTIVAYIVYPTIRRRGNDARRNYTNTNATRPRTLRTEASAGEPYLNSNV